MQIVRWLPASIVATLILAGCAGMGGSLGNGNPFAKLSLFSASGEPRFSFYYSCTGSVTVETELCWVPSKYFAEWVNTNHARMKPLQDGGDFDAATGVPARQLLHEEGGLTYRVVVCFEPVAVQSFAYQLSQQTLGGYSPPRAGYLAQIFVYTIADGKLVAKNTLAKRTEAHYKSNAVPYVKAGVEAVIAALDPAHAQVAER
jgi:hypothetical protein